MEKAECKTTNGASRRATPDAPERIGHPRRCTGHGRRTPDGGSARERVPTASHVRKRVETCNAVTRRSASTIQGAARGHGRRTPDGALRAGARPYRAARAQTPSRRATPDAPGAHRPIQGAAPDTAVGRLTAAPRGSASLPAPFGHHTFIARPSSPQ